MSESTREVDLKVSWKISRCFRRDLWLHWASVSFDGPDSKRYHLEFVVEATCTILPKSTVDFVKTSLQARYQDLIARVA